MKEFLHYKLDTLMGQGGFGEVWSATDLLTKASVAIKFVRLNSLP